MRVPPAPHNRVTRCACVSAGSSSPLTPTPGYVSNDRVTQTLCGTLGYWCFGGVMAPCNAGSYGSATGLSTSSCSGACAAGYYCVAASTSATASRCTGVQFCVAGSSAPATPALGLYTADNKAVLPCPRGFWCAAGEVAPCVAGRYGGTTGLSISTCSGPCSAGFFCPAGSNNATAAVCVNVGGAWTYCPPASSAPLVPADGYYPNSNRSSVLACNPGFWCKGGVKSPCSDGYYGGLAESRATCTGPCTAGYFCFGGSISPTQHVCVVQGLNYCPTGSSQPLLPGAGWIATDDMTASELCAMGSYCVGGIASSCLAGQYGSARGMVAAACSGPCSQGYYCPAGSTRATQIACSGVGYYCGGGAGAPQATSSGYYASSDMTSQIICPAGSYCVGGLRFACPAGTFGAVVGLTSPTCSGPCAAGFTCAAGSTSATQSSCSGASAVHAAARSINLLLQPLLSSSSCLCMSLWVM